MTNVTGLGSVIFWAVEASFKNAGAGMPVTGTAVHQPFNPIEGGIDLPLPFYQQEVVYTQESLNMDVNLTYDKSYEPAAGLFPNDKGCIVHDPMPMLAFMFPNKVLSGTWGGGAGTYGKIIADFTVLTYEDTVMIQYKTIDSASNVVEEKTLLGVKSTEYRLGFKKGDVLREKFQLIVAQELDNTRAFSASASFDNGKWADWAKSTVYPASDCKLFWDDSFAAELVDFNVEEAEFIIRTPQEYLTDKSSLIPFARINGKREYLAQVKGYIMGDTELDEYRAAYSAKTKKNLRLQWDSTTNETKFMDIDDAHIVGIGATRVPAADEVWRTTLQFRGISCDFEGNYNNLADPDARITD